MVGLKVGRPRLRALLLHGLVDARVHADGRVERHRHERGDELEPVERAVVPEVSHRWMWGDNENEKKKKEKQTRAQLNTAIQQHSDQCSRILVSKTDYFLGT